MPSSAGVVALTTNSSNDGNDAERLGGPRDGDRRLAPAPAVDLAALGRDHAKLRAASALATGSGGTSALRSGLPGVPVSMRMHVIARAATRRRSGRVRDACWSYGPRSLRKSADGCYETTAIRAAGSRRATGSVFEGGSCLRRRVRGRDPLWQRAAAGPRWLLGRRCRCGSCAGCQRWLFRASSYTISLRRRWRRPSPPAPRAPGMVDAWTKRSSSTSPTHRP